MTIRAERQVLATTPPQAKAPVERPEASTDGGPALSLAGLQFFIADIAKKSILWHEIGSQTFDSKVKDLQEAPSNEALRHLAPEDRQTIMRLVKGAIQEGKAGPFDVGGGQDHRIPGIPIVAYRYELPDGRIIAICFPSTGVDDTNPGRMILGLSPILQHFVASSNRVVLLIDNFGYVRYANEGFIKSFKIEDERLILGRNIAHVQNRVGRTIVSLALASLTRRASATGRGKFLLASNESLELNYDAMYFRIGGSVGGVLFSAGSAGGDLDFAKVFEAVSAPILVVNSKSRMIVAANKAATRAYQLTSEVISAKPVTETLFHPGNFAMLLEAAGSGSELPVSAPVSLASGQTKKKRFRCVLIDQDKDEPKLLLETRS